MVTTNGLKNMRVTAWVCPRLLDFAFRTNHAWPKGERLNDACRFLHGFYLVQSTTDTPPQERCAKVEVAQARLVPIGLIVILVYAAQWAVHVPGTAPTNVAAGIAIAAAAAALWILHPRKVANHVRII